MNGLYVLRRGRFELRRTGEPTLGIGFRESFDTVLRRLDVTYVADAWTNVAATLARFDIDPTVCHWGECHPGVLGAFGDELEDSPLEGVGWVLSEGVASPGRLRDEPLLWRELDTALAEHDPPLCLFSDYYRARRASLPGGQRIEPSDTTTGLELLLALLGDDVVPWRGRSRPGPDAWIRIANAIAASDETAFAAAVTDAQQHYTPAGMKLCLEGFGAFLLQWTRHGWTATD